MCVGNKGEQIIIKNNKLYYNGRLGTHRQMVATNV